MQGACKAGSQPGGGSLEELQLLQPLNGGAIHLACQSYFYIYLHTYINMYAFACLMLGSLRLHPPMMVATPSVARVRVWRGQWPIWFMKPGTCTHRGGQEPVSHANHACAHWAHEASRACIKRGGQGHVSLVHMCAHLAHEAWTSRISI